MVGYEEMNGGYDNDEVRSRMADVPGWFAHVCLAVVIILSAGAAMATVLPDELQDAIARTGIPDEAVGIVVEPLDGSGPIVSLNADDESCDNVCRAGIVGAFKSLENGGLYDGYSGKRRFGWRSVYPREWRSVFFPG